MLLHKLQTARFFCGGVEKDFIFHKRHNFIDFEKREGEEEVWGKRVVEAVYDSQLEGLMPFITFYYMLEYIIRFLHFTFANADRRKAQLGLNNFAKLWDILYEVLLHNMFV